MEVLLSQYCGEDDIVTPIYPASAHHRPRNYLADNGGREFYNHMPATKIQELAPEAFGEFYKFCFERHPVDKCLSHFAMLLNNPFHQSDANPKTWDEYIDRGDFPVDHALYTDDNEQLLVDKIYKYENLNDALVDISNKTGLSLNKLSYFEKSGLRYGVPSFSDVMGCSNQVDIIIKKFETTLKFVSYF